METTYSSRWKIKWQLEYLGTLEIMCKTAPLWLISKSAICQLHLRDCYDYCDKYMTTA